MLRLLQTLTFPSNGVIRKVVLHDLDLLFQGQIFKNDSISETVRANSKYAIWLLHILIFATEWRHCKVVLSDLDLLFQGKIFQMLISWKR